MSGTDAARDRMGDALMDYEGYFQGSLIALREEGTTVFSRISSGSAGRSRQRSAAAAVRRAM